MAETLLLTLSLLLGVCAMAWFALAKDAHWKQIGKSLPVGATTVRRLYALGAGALAASLVCCLSAEHATIAVLVWIMLQSAAALVVTFTLAWRPRWLSLLAGRSRSS